MCFFLLFFQSCHLQTFSELFSFFFGSTKLASCWAGHVWSSGRSARLWRQSSWVQPQLCVFSVGLSLHLFDFLHCGFIQLVMCPMLFLFEMLHYPGINYQPWKKDIEINLSLQEAILMKSILTVPSMGQKHGYKCSVWVKKM